MRELFRHNSKLQKIHKLSSKPTSQDYQPVNGENFKYDIETVDCSKIENDRSINIGTMGNIPLQKQTCHEIIDGLHKTFKIILFSYQLI